MTEIDNFLPRNRPAKLTISGKYVRLEPLDWDVHADGLGESIAGEENSDLWKYVPIGPFDNIENCKTVMSYVGKQLDWQSMCIVSQVNNIGLGTASYMRLRPQHGSAEVGCVVYGKSLQRTREATEVIYLMASHLFDDLNYRRFEWKCDDENETSKRAANRFGFTYEGIFRNDMIMKNRNRNTAWFSIIDKDWPRLSMKYKSWLADENFDEQGQQIKRLQDC